MARITDALVIALNRQTLRADCFGNNAAVECPRCLSYPVLIIARPNQRGSSAQNPSICRHCKARLYITNDLSQRTLRVVNLAVEYEPLAVNPEYP